MAILVVRHPIMTDLIGRLRNRQTPPPEFRRLLREAAAILMYEATRNWPTEIASSLSPLGVQAEYDRLLSPGPIVIPILRAGLGMLDAALSILPYAELGVLGYRALLTMMWVTQRPSSPSVREAA